MPSNTFARLKADKKEQFIQLALEEFALNGYESASITQIVKRLEIAKGSVYQYFENKKDLFFYLIEYVNQQKQTAIATIFKQNHQDFFELYEQMFVAGTLFDLKNPLYSLFLHQVAQERNSDTLGNLNQMTLKQSSSYFSQLLKSAQAKGNIRADLDLDLMAFWYAQTSINFLDYLILKYKIDFKAIISEKSDLLHIISEKELEKMIAELVELMRNGLGTSQKA